MPKDKPSLETWLAEMTSLALPVESFHHLYLLSIVQSGVHYVKVGVTEFDHVAVRGWSIKTLEGAVIPFTIIGFLPRAIPKFEIRKGKPTYTGATLESVMKAVLRSTCSGYPKNIIIDGNVSSETFKCSRGYAVSALARCLSSMHLIKDHGYFWFIAQISVYVF